MAPTLVLALVLVAGACSGGDGSTATGTTTTTVADTTTTTQGPPCPTVSHLTVTELEQTTDTDAPNGFAQIVDDDGDGTLLLTITDAPIDRTAAFAEDDPVLAPGQALVRMRASHAGGGIDVATYHDYSDATSDGRVVETSAVYTGEGRLLPTEGHHIDITEITPDHVCGRIVNDGDDATYYRSTFIATRVG